MQAVPALRQAGPTRHGVCAVEGDRTLQTLEEAVRDCGGRVTVVGNGPLTETNRKEIEASKCVVRFNDMKNMRPGERVTIQATRFARKSNAFAGRAKFGLGAALLPVAPGPYVPATAPGANDVLRPLPTYERYDRRHADLTLFHGCAACEGGLCKYGSAPWGPSTGAIVIDALQQLGSVDVIPVYGMNWSGSLNHVDFRAPGIVPGCCTKCIVTDTPSRDYMPR